MSRNITPDSTSNKRPAETNQTSAKKSAPNPMMAGIYRQNEDNEDGYTLDNNSYHLSSHNPYSRGNPTTIIYTLKNRQYIDFNCCTNGQKAWILPYKNFKFWLPEKSTNNYKNWYTLMSISHGWNILNLNI